MYGYSERKIIGMPNIVDAYSITVKCAEYRDVKGLIYYYAAQKMIADKPSGDIYPGRKIEISPPFLCSTYISEASEAEGQED